jgi:hypothetical protein
MSTHNWSNDFRDLLRSLSISLYPTSMLTEVIDAYGITKKSFNSTFRTRYSDIDDIKKNAFYYEKKAPFMMVDDKTQAICAFVKGVSDIINESSYNMICLNTVAAISLPAQYCPRGFEEYISLAKYLQNGDKKEKSVYKANEKLFCRIDLILHHLQDVDLSSIAVDNAAFLQSHIEVKSFG